MENIRNLRSFAAFLLEKERLHQAVMLNIKAARKHHSTIIDKLGPHSEEEIVELFTRSFGNFLKAIADNKGFDNIHDSFDQWKKNNYNLPSSTIQATDVMMAFEIRKDVLTKLIPTYTSDMAQNLQIREEIDALFFIARKTGMAYITNNSFPPQSFASRSDLNRS